MNDRYGWEDRDDRKRYRRQSGEGSHRSGYENTSREQSAGSSDRWRSEDEDLRSRSSFDRDRYQGQSDYDRQQRGGSGSTFGYGEGRSEGRVGGYGAAGYGAAGYGAGQAGDNRGAQQSYASQDQRHQQYSSSGYGYSPSQQGDGPPQPYFTGQQQGWEVPSSYGAPGTFGASYGGGSGTYGGGAGGYQGYGEDYRDRAYGGGQESRGFLQKAGDEVASWFGDEEAARRREQDHRGRGPQGYTRSDERIREDANDRLTEDWRVDASGISVTVESGEVTLNGTVSRREDKRRAEDLVEDISGVKHVQNNLRVQQNSSWSSTSGSSGGTSSGATTGTASGSTSASTGSASGIGHTPTSETKDKTNTSPT